MRHWNLKIECCLKASYLTNTETNEAFYTLRRIQNHSAHALPVYDEHKQVILLSTDEEIDKKYHKFISPYLARSYKIEYDEKLNGSKLTEGYFF